MITQTKPVDCLKKHEELNLLLIGRISILMLSYKYEFTYNLLITFCTFPKFIWPFLFRATTADVDYLENQCAENPIGQATCDYQEYENQDIGFPDLQVTVANQAEVGCAVSLMFSKISVF